MSHSPCRAMRRNFSASHLPIAFQQIVDGLAVDLRGKTMEIEKGTPPLWYDTAGRIPIRVVLPIDFTASEAKAALEEFVSLLAELAVMPYADKVTLGEAYACK
jgi:hypothetical protein